MSVGLWSNCKGSLAGDIALGSTAAVTYVINTRSGGDEATGLTQPSLEKSTTPKAFMRVTASFSSPCFATSGQHYLRLIVSTWMFVE